MTFISDPSGDLSALWGWKGWGIAALALLVILTIRAIHHAPTQPAEPSNLDVRDGLTEHCSIPFCDNPVTIHLSVAHDYWPFCLGHGMPYLTDGLRDKEDAS